jgi:hypothetical protein
MQPEKSKAKLNADDQKHNRKEEHPERAKATKPTPMDEPAQPGKRNESKGEQDALNKTTRRGER